MYFRTEKNTQMFLTRQRCWWKMNQKFRFGQNDKILTERTKSNGMRFYECIPADFQFKHLYTLTKYFYDISRFLLQS